MSASFIIAASSFRNDLGSNDTKNSLMNYWICLTDLVAVKRCLFPTINLDKQSRISYLFEGQLPVVIVESLVSVHFLSIDIGAK